MIDLVFPILPARTTAGVAAFYAGLGFATVLDTGDYAIVRRGAMELHFFRWDACDPATSICGAYARVADPDALHAEWSALGFPPEGAPRLTAIEDKPWGMREFALVDSEGNLLRVGRPLAT